MSIKIHARSLHHLFTYSISPIIDVQALRLKVQGDLQISLGQAFDISRIELYSNGNKLEPGKTVASYNVRDDETLSLVLLGNATPAHAQIESVPPP